MGRWLESILLMASRWPLSDLTAVDEADQMDSIAVPERQARRGPVARFHFDSTL